VISKLLQHTKLTNN